MYVRIEKLEEIKIASYIRINDCEFLKKILQTVKKYFFLRNVEIMESRIWNPTNSEYR